MTTKQEIINYCLTFAGAYEDYPFNDPNWTLIRHVGNNKTFAFIFYHKDKIWINIKGKPEWNEFNRKRFSFVIPAYHMNKTHWNSIILSEDTPDDIVKGLIQESYDLTKPKQKQH